MAITGESETTALLNQSTVAAGAAAGTTFVNKAHDRIKKASLEGPLSWRVMAFIGGLAMIFSNAIAIIERFMTFRFARSILAIYGVIFGIIITVLEGTWACPTRLQRGVRYYAKFLEYCWGRGMLYFFVGTMKISNINILDWAVGGWMIFVGVIAMCVGISTSRKLKALRRTIQSEEHLKEKWEEADADKNGTLDIKELTEFTKDAGLDMSKNELAAAFLTLDRNFDEKITFEEFYHWWMGAASLEAENSLLV